MAEQEAVKRVQHQALGAASGRRDHPHVGRAQATLTQVGQRHRAGKHLQSAGAGAGWQRPMRARPRLVAQNLTSTPALNDRRLLRLLTLACGAPLSGSSSVTLRVPSASRLLAARRRLVWRSNAHSR